MRRIVVPGVAVIASTFGLARYGYGLLIPDMRASFGLDGATVGLLASSAYLSYLCATVVSILVVRRLEPRGCVLVAAALASVGMATIAAASDAAMLAVGVIAAGASSGLALPPFADLAAQYLDPAERGGGLAAISSGTGWGVVLAGPIAMLLAPNWRATWFVFAGVGLLVYVLAMALVPRSTPPATCLTTPPRVSVQWFLCPRSRPLLVSSFLVGLAASVYWTFGPDLVKSTQDATTARILFIVVGVSSIGGSFAYSILRRVGATLGFRLCGAVLATSFAVLVFGASSVMLVVASGLLFGITYNLVVAIQVIWSDDVFASRPSAGLAATMLMFALGQIIGPTLAGVIIDHTDATTAFALAALAMSMTLMAVPPRTLRSSGLQA